MRRILFAAALIISTPAHASTWFAVNLDGNKCLTMDGFVQESLTLGIQPVGSPEMFVALLRMGGVNPSVSVTELGNRGKAAIITWTSPQGDTLGRKFFTNISTCQTYVAYEIKIGSAMAPDALR
jgi:hypothetical protein